MSEALHVPEERRASRLSAFKGEHSLWAGSITRYTFFPVAHSVLKPAFFTMHVSPLWWQASPILALWQSGSSWTLFAHLAPNGIGSIMHSHGLFASAEVDKVAATAKQQVTRSMVEWAERRVLLRWVQILFPPNTPSGARGKFSLGAAPVASCKLTPCVANDGLLLGLHQQIGCARVHVISVSGHFSNAQEYCNYPYERPHHNEDDHDGVVVVVVLLFLFGL